MDYNKAHDRKVMIVDDSEQFSMLISEQLTHLGYQVPEISHNYNDAMNKTQKIHPDLVLMDVNLKSDVDGIDIANELREKFSIPVVFVTSDSDNETINRAQKTEPYGYLIKPFNIQDLNAVMEVAFKRLELENMLSLKEKKYRSLFEESKDAVFIVDSDGAIVDANRAMTELTGYSFDELTSMAMNDLYSNLDELVKVYNQMAKTGFIKEMEVEIKKKNTDNVYTLISANLVDASAGNGDNYQYIIKEITPLKQKALEEVQRHVEHLNEVLEGIIKASILTVEVRDPYTAGHQKEVAEIAVDIAKEMSLDEGVVEGIRIAGLLHDLGKISIPSEILSKPGKLNEFEYSLIKAHPDVGYNILKQIKFPWPIAEIVRQHHERIDGSGYPEGLSGEDILLEARIIGIADVLEAMSSHRPYRPSMGIDKAIAEINDKKGILYDDRIVEAINAILKRRGNNIPVDVR